jgi:membrane protease YdiL (CAAX protease family)
VSQGGNGHAEVLLDGSWERPGRNPLGAGVSGILICGALYSTLGALVLSIIMLVVSAVDGTWAGTGGFLEILSRYYARFQVPILAVTAAGEITIFLGLTFVLVRRWHSSTPAAYLGYARPSAVDLLLAGVGAVSVVPIAELLDSWTYFLLPVLRELRGGQESLLSIHTPLQLVLVVGTIALVPAVCEEVLFRGWLQTTLRRRLSLPLAIVIQGIIFALFHTNPLSVVALAFVGFYLGWLFQRSGTLFASMTAHCLYNATILALVNLHPRALVSAQGTIKVPVMGAAVLVFALVVLLMELRHGKRHAH